MYEQWYISETHATYGCTLRGSVTLSEGGVVGLPKPKGGTLGHRESVLLCSEWWELSSGVEVEASGTLEEGERKGLDLHGTSPSSSIWGAMVLTALALGRVSEEVSPVWAFGKAWMIKMQMNDHNSWSFNGTSSWKASKSFPIYCSKQNAAFSNNTARYKRPQTSVKREHFKYSHCRRCI